MSETNVPAHPAVRVGDFVKARSGAEGVVRESCGLGVWINCADPTPFSDYGNPVGVDWKDIVFHANTQISGGTPSAESDCYAGDCTTCGGPVFHRDGKPGEYDHECRKHNAEHEGQA